jgi:hypothetical protein
MDRATATVAQALDEDETGKTCWQAQARCALLFAPQD